MTAAAALVPPSQLRMRGPCSPRGGGGPLLRSSLPPPPARLRAYPATEAPADPLGFDADLHRRRSSRLDIDASSVQQSLPAQSRIANYYPWRRRRGQQCPSGRLEGTVLMARSKEKSSFLEEDSLGGIISEEELNELDCRDAGSLHSMEEGNDRIAGVAVAGQSASPSKPPELWGVPVQSVVLLNLVAVIWGTQHSVIKSVVDDSTIGLGAGFFRWLESAGVTFNGMQTDILSGASSAASGDNAAAYFTLARFGLAAVLASPYTPGLRMRGGGDAQEPVDGLDGANIEGRAQPSDKESVRLAWKYGAELGLYMFLGYAFQAIGLETTTASRSGFLLYLNVKFVPFISYFIFGKPIMRSTWVSALVAFSGTALLAFDDAGGSGKGLGGMAFAVGDLWSIAAAAASAMFILRMETASKAVPRSSELNAANLWTVAVLSLLWTLGLSWNELSGADAASGGIAIVRAARQTLEQTASTIAAHPIALIYLSGVTTALANLLQSKAQKDVSAERASVIYAMDPVYGAIFANVLLGETLGGFGLVGAFLIVLAAATNAVLDFGPGVKAVEGAKEKR